MDDHAYGSPKCPTNEHPGEDGVRALLLRLLRLVITEALRSLPEPDASTDAEDRGKDRGSGGGAR